MTKQIKEKPSKAVSAYFSKLGKKGGHNSWIVRQHIINENAKRNKTNRPNKKA